MKSLDEMEEWKRIQGSTFDEFSRKRLIENQDTILELTARIQELQNETSCMNDSSFFEDAESVRSGLSHVTSQLALLPFFRDLGGMLSRSVGMQSRNDRPPDIWDTQGISWKRCCKSNSVFFNTVSRRDQCMNFQSPSIRGISMPKFEVFDARIASALDRIIHHSHFKRRISLEEQKAQKQDRVLRGSQIAYLIYEYIRDIGAGDSVENYADLFAIVLRNDDTQEFDSKWEGILLSITKISPDDILEELYKQRIRESDKFKTVLELKQW